MEFIKKYWWVFFLLPVVGYFLYTFAIAKQKVNEGAAKAREAKAEKAIIREALSEVESERNN